ncbi:tRNA (N(6)-L-threonylcarbamoyladenosine(37)-C(2))-methylthiotransferase MtaB [Anaerotalea alkaliphila]|uniref:Threonylcarbamoyladenosine tRNA methylthiotransferase MtaB n=1 Tax=Anaerotalea alkaliphila TaxID=2662126 RepID=A0A7X5HX37_9FIRM|nr:tRNA (N(6)-L-threonylcarbamoyladenosine(37)-C(2))-methylthiotransferase MtaB [Anaerotalea alkaliphila]NDL68220.1 tRNA (N(6)-L-threonylcarbamoyladenosine(37)-C(2))-methylthiotransferase MtaB [Anaerotalea alkaliphila]
MEGQRKIDLGLEKDAFFKAYGRDRIVATHTLGCKVNQYETDAIRSQFEEKGYTVGDFDGFADVYIVNTCTVTNIADKKSRQMLAKARKQNPQGLVVAVGCYAQTAKESLEENHGIDLLVGNTKKSQVLSLVERHVKALGGGQGIQEETVEDMTRQTAYEDLWTTRQEDRNKAHVKVQDGCDQFCSYCIIPFTRGRVRSRKPESVLAEVESLAAQGFREVVLAGIHLASYGKEFDGYGLIDLLEELDRVEGLSKVHLGSLEPNLVGEAFLERLARLSRFHPHFHLSLQSGSDATLARMNRKYDTASYREKVALLRRAFPEAVLTTDIIVGFPGETEGEFAQTLAFAKEMAFAHVHVFKYSPREGTVAAARKDQVDAGEKNRRSEILRQAFPEL